MGEPNIPRAEHLKCIVRFGSVIDLGGPWAGPGVPAPGKPRHGARHGHAQLRSEKEIGTPRHARACFKDQEGTPGPGPGRHGAARRGTVRHGLLIKLKLCSKTALFE